MGSLKGSILHCALLYSIFQRIQHSTTLGCKKSRLNNSLLFSCWHDIVMTMLLYRLFSKFDKCLARTWGLETTGKHLGFGLTMTSWKVQLFNLLVRLMWIVICFVYPDNEENLRVDKFKVVKPREDVKDFMQ